MHTGALQNGAPFREWVLPAAPARLQQRLARVRHRARGQFFNVVELFNRLDADAKSGQPGRLVDALVAVNLEVLDEFRNRPFVQSRGQFLFHLVSRLYERTSVIVTTYLD